MCHSILVIHYRVNESATVRCDTPEALAQKSAELEANPEVLSYRTFVTTGKRVRVTTMEDQP